MAIMSSRLIRHEICKDEFKKMGGKVIDIQGMMFIVDFNLSQYNISYVYYLNEDNTFLLDRIKPYFLSIGYYENEEEIVDIIRSDIDQFKNAMNSTNFDQFVEIDNHLAKLVRLFEDLYLYYNIDKSDIIKLDESVNCILDNIKEIMNHSDRAYTKKEPEVLKDSIEF